MLTLLMTLCTPGLAQPVLETNHPLVPAAGVASEGGPGTLWVNPASIGLDRDARYGAYLTQPGDGAWRAMAITGGAEGFGLGLEWTEDPQGEQAWKIDYASSVVLPGGWALGGMLQWHLPEGTPNHVGYDAGLSWRPLSWLGIGGVAQNIGSPDPLGLTVSRTAVGVAVRPLGRTLLVGVDAQRLHREEPLDQLHAHLRVRASEGLYFRTGMTLDAPSTAGLSLAHAGAGLEMFFGDGGGGYHYGGAPHSNLHTVWFGSDEPNESLIDRGHRFGRLNLKETPPYQRANLLFVQDKRANWAEVMALLDEAQSSSKLDGVLITLGNAPMSWALHEELQARFRDLRAADRQVVVYLEGSPSTATYVTAAGADVIWMHPASNLDLTGVKATFMHLRGALDLLGIEPEHVRRSEYKSGPEQYARHEPSEPALEQVEALLDDRVDAIRAGLSSGRNVETQTVETWIQGGPYSATEALDLGMIDAIAYPDQIHESLETWHGDPVQMSALADLRPSPTGWQPTSRIAVIYIDGVIVDGKSSAGGLLGSRQSGSDTVVSQLRQASQDPTVKAVVLRVDSPGGSAYASDEIHRAVSLVQNEGKPVVASFGGVAASGGYYVAAGADTIWAEPNTVTGSIGVYTVKFAAEEMLEHVGIETTTIAHGAHADLYSMVDPWDASERARVEALVQDTYTRFKDIVATGRDLSEEEVEQVARGRVWSGRDAKEVGLVDQFGGLLLAIDDARQQAGIPDHHEVGLATYSGDLSLLEALSPTLVRNAISRALDHRPTSEVPAVLRATIETLEPVWVMAAHPEERAWAIDTRFWSGAPQ